jgi:hypothetical protein
MPRLWSSFAGGGAEHRERRHRGHREPEQARTRGRLPR